MSADHGSQGHGHDDHGHGHHGPDVRTPLVIAAIFIIAFGAGVYYLVTQGMAARAHAVGGGHGAAPGANEGHGQGHAAAPAVKAVDDPSQRETFAATFHRRQRAMGFKFEAAVAGPHRDVLQISWAAKAEPGKVETLKQAADFQREARGRGFARIVLREAGRTLWEKVL